MNVSYSHMFQTTISTQIEPTKITLKRNLNNNSKPMLREKYISIFM